MEYTPYKYQLMVKKEILSKDKAILEFRDGMGKMSIVISAIKELLDKGEINKILVLVPSLYKMKKWMKEVKSWDYLKGIRIVKIEGNSKREFMDIEESNIYITHRENIAWISEKKEVKFDMIVIDEIDMFANPKSLRYKKMLAVCEEVKKIVGIMNVKQNIEYKLWDIINIIDSGERLGKNKAGYYDRFFFSYMDRNNKTIHRDLKKEAKKAIYRAIEDIIINEESVGKEFIPQKLYTKTELELDEKELSKYTYLLDNNVNGDELRCLTNGSIEIKGQRFVLHNKKIFELRFLCDSCDESIVIIYRYEDDLQIIKENIMDIKVIQSMNDVQKWNEGKFRWIAINMEFGGIENWFKMRGKRVVWYSLPESLNTYVNMNRRFQWDENNCLIIHNLVVKDTIDEVLFRRIGEF